MSSRSVSSKAENFFNFSLALVRVVWNLASSRMFGTDQDQTTPTTPMTEESFEKKQAADILAGGTQQAKKSDSNIRSELVDLFSSSQFFDPDLMEVCKFSGDPTGNTIEHRFSSRRHEYVIFCSGAQSLGFSIWGTARVRTTSRKAKDPWERTCELQRKSTKTPEDGIAKILAEILLLEMEA